MLSVATETTAKVLYERRMRVVRELGAVSATTSGCPADTCRAVLEVLGTARQTMPFVVALLTGDDGVAHRVAEYGLAADAAIPGVTDTDVATDCGGVLGRVVRTGRGEEVTGLREEFPGALLPGPLGPLTPDVAVVAPLTVSGRADPVGALVVGVNPYRPLDAEYRAFFTLIGRQFRVALSDAAAYEAEREKARLLADLDRAKMEFFQNVSHELRTPLTLLLAPLQDLLVADHRPPREREDLRAAVRAAERLRGMVDALLDFSGAEHRSLDPDRQPIDLAALTADTASMFRSAAEHAGLSFDVDVPAAPLTAAADRAMWSTIVTNLLSNALKYTDRGGIRVRLTGADGQAVLTVADTGIGIEPDQQALVFDRFYRAAPDNDIVDNPDGGAGIGLAVVSDLVHAHHGTVTMSSIPGAGSTFTVTMPLAAGHHAGQDQGLLASAPTSGGPRLLLVEDDSDLRAYVTRILTHDGWAVHAVPDAETALTATIQGPVDELPQVVLTDVMLPGRSGLQLVGDLRSDPATSRVPVIVLTARHGDQATAEGLAAGADDYITKPFSSQELLARVRAAHELARMRETAVETAETKAEQIRAALDSNRVIGTAVGIVMATYRLTAQQGFDLLVKASQNSNRKLRDIAADVTAARTLPMRPTLVDDLLIRVAT